MLAVTVFVVGLWLNCIALLSDFNAIGYSVFLNHAVKILNTQFREKNTKPYLLERIFRKCHFISALAWSKTPRQKRIGVAKLCVQNVKLSSSVGRLRKS